MVLKFVTGHNILWDSFVHVRLQPYSHPVQVLQNRNETTVWLNKIIHEHPGGNGEIKHRVYALVK